MAPVGQDEEIQRIQAAVSAGMSAIVTQIEVYRKSWDKYRGIWATDKDAFVQRYGRLNVPVSSFDADLNRSDASWAPPEPPLLGHVFTSILPPRYTEKANTIEQEDSLVNILAVQVDCSALKSLLVQHCSEWQSKFTQLLSDKATSRMKELYSLMQRSDRCVPAPPPPPHRWKQGRGRF